MNKTKESNSIKFDALGYVINGKLHTILDLHYTQQKQIPTQDFNQIYKLKETTYQLKVLRSFL